MIEHLNFSAVNRLPDLKSSMLADRKRVFVDTLKWDLDHDGEHESDQFDNHEAEYLVLKSPKGSHKASVRLLPTTGAHILGDIFPYLCEAEVPRGPKIREITRYLASPRDRAAERVRARNMMARALIEFGLDQGIEAYTAVCDISFLSQILSAGWRCSPLGFPQNIDGAMIGAFMIHVEEDSIERMVPAWKFDGTALFCERQLHLKLSEAV